MPIRHPGVNQTTTGQSALGDLDTVQLPADVA